MSKVSADDWRRMGQEKKLSGAQLVHRPWRESRPGWDHDHCEFCWAKFADETIPAALHCGYCTEDEYHWICETCFADFREEFEFGVLAEASVPTVAQLRERFGLGAE